LDAAENAADVGAGIESSACIAAKRERTFAVVNPSSKIYPISISCSIKEKIPLFVAAKTFPTGVETRALIWLAFNLLRARLHVAPLSVDKIFLRFNSARIFP